MALESVERCLQTLQRLTESKDNRVVKYLMSAVSLNGEAVLSDKGMGTSSCIVHFATTKNPKQYSICFRLNLKSLFMSKHYTSPDSLYHEPCFEVKEGKTVLYHNCTPQPCHKWKLL